MVDFVVFNELSLPLDENKVKENFKDFFNLLKELKVKNLDTIRMDKDFKNYEILPNITLQKFFGQLNDRDLKERLRQFITKNIINIDSPLIKENEIEEKANIIENEYFYNESSTIGGLACCYIWNTLSVSFNSATKWHSCYISLRKDTIIGDNIESKEIKIKHMSQVEHLNCHQDFFDEIENAKISTLTQEKFWDNRNKFFKKIIFTIEVEKQVKNLDKIIFHQALNILRDIERGKKTITDFNYSGESDSVKNDKKLKKLREFTINNEKIYFDCHIKSLSNANRIYFLERDSKIYIGYIGKHLPTKKF